MNEVAVPNAVEPAEWFVVFHTRSTRRWLGWLARGRFKHVSAFASYPGFKAWLLFDPQWSGLRLMMLSHAAAKIEIARYTEDCAVVKIARGGKPMGLSARLGFYCVPAVAHLIGVRCGMARPDAFYRHILRRGGKLIDGREQGTGDPGRPEPGR